MKNKILISLMLLGMFCCTFSTINVSASENNNVLQPRIHVEEVIKSYESVYNASPFTWLCDENKTYTVIQYVNDYTVTKTEKGCTTLADALKGNVRYRYTYTYKTR